MSLYDRRRYHVTRLDVNRLHKPGACAACWWRLNATMMVLLPNKRLQPSQGNAIAHTHTHTNDLQMRAAGRRDRAVPPQRHKAWKGSRRSTAGRRRRAKIPSTMMSTLCFPELATSQLGKIRSQMLPTSARCWPKPAQIWQNSVQILSSPAPSWTNPRQIWPTHDQAAEFRNMRTIKLPREVLHNTTCSSWPTKHAHLAASRRPPEE